MKRFFTYLVIGIIAGIAIDIISLPIFYQMDPTLFAIPIISAILGALVGGYWKQQKGAWIGGVGMGLFAFIAYFIIFAMGGFPQ